MDGVESEISGLRQENIKISKSVAVQKVKYQKLKEENNLLLNKVSACESKIDYLLNRERANNIVLFKITKMSKYIRKTDRKLRFTVQIMEAIKKELSEGKSKRQIAKEFNIPEATLRKRLVAGTIPSSLGRFKCVFSPEQELQLANHIKDLDIRFYGLTKKDCQMLAFEYAEANNIENPFIKEKKAAGDKWINNFFARQNLSLRQPEKCSMGRVMGFNKVQMDRFFANLKTLYEKYQFSPDRIFNMDETGLSTVPNKMPKVISQKGKKLVGRVSSAERGQLVTGICCMSASGLFIPPGLIFPRKRMRDDLFTEAPAGTLKMVSESGFINNDLFFLWMQHFKEYTRPSQDSPVLLVFDNHISHRTLKFVEYCQQNFIELITIPPHSSHKVQPLDKGYFGPLKVAYGQFCDMWLVNHPGKVITQTEVAFLFKQAYQKVSSIDKGVKSFESTGIFPFNSEIFTDEDFAPSFVSDRPFADNNVVENVIQQQDNNYIVPEVVEMLVEQTAEDIENAVIIIEGVNYVENLIITDETRNVPSVVEVDKEEDILRLTSEIRNVDQEVQASEMTKSPADLRPLPRLKTTQIRNKSNQKSERQLMEKKIQKEQKAMEKKVKKAVPGKSQPKRKK
ncbi:uncharacterized protein LOC127282288 [Leptopilina boulardi]|uniref:uncharacterized protein LOC127282288 n=1 Tax=Leptopilina boulardi TaxID=63433 RepID=UPI0021F54720|nr:uncharacterized protein LOC127282288 [Leptopilina boulardi]